MFTSVLLAAALSAAPSTSGGKTTFVPFPSGQAQTVNIVNWEANQLPKVYERSDQLPLTDEEVTKLSKAGFDTAALVKMVEERRCACDASADGLIKLKQAGVAKEVISSISLHAVQPNRAVVFDVVLDFVGDSNDIRESFLYLFVDDGDLTRVLTANLAELLQQRRTHDDFVDRSDILRARRVRRVHLPGEIALKRYGKHNLLVVTSANPTLTHPSQLSEKEKVTAQSYSFDYPRASLQSVCRLNAGFKRDALLAYKWQQTGSRLECEWN